MIGLIVRPQALSSVVVDEAIDPAVAAAMSSAGTVRHNSHGFDHRPRGRSRRWASQPAGMTGGSGARTGSLARCSPLPLTVPTQESATVVARSTSFPFCFDWTADDELLVTGRRGLERLGPDRRLVPTPTSSSSRSTDGTRSPCIRSGAAYVNGINFDMMGADGMNCRARLQATASSPWSHPTAAPASSPTPSPFRTAWPSRPTVHPARRRVVRLAVAVFDVDDDHGLTNRRVWPRSTVVPTA